MAVNQPRRRSDAERNAETILAVTRDLLAAGPVPTMSEVAAAAAVTRPTLYAHFPTRELLLEAVVRRAIEETDRILSGLDLGTGDVDEALERLVQSSWPILDRHRKVRLAALDHLGPSTLRDQHDAALRHLEELLVRGQKGGVFRTDLPREWLIATFYAVVHAAADEVDAGRLTSEAAPDVVIASLRSLLHSS